MLIIPPNIADMVRERVAASTPLDANDIYFTATHTHCGPGAFGPGFAAKISGGTYDPAIPELLVEAFSTAILGAYTRLAPAKLAHGVIDAEGLIRNRTRQAPVDPNLNFLVVEQDDGDRCYMTRFSGHPTIFGGSML